MYPYAMYFKSKKELNYDIFVDPIILGAARLVHSDLRIYRISFFLLDRICLWNLHGGPLISPLHANHDNSRFKSVLLAD